MNGPFTSKCKSKIDVENGGFDNGIEGVSVVDARGLMDFFGNKVSLVAIKKTIRFFFLFVLKTYLHLTILALGGEETRVLL